jgi:hypothetical protein
MTRMTDADLVHDPGHLLHREHLAWEELWGLVSSLTPEERERPGYYPDDRWSVKDMVAHIGTWMAQAAAIIAQVRANTHRPDELDIDAMNARFYEAMHDMAWETVETQALAARAQMLGALRQLVEPDEISESWVRKSGPDHYAEHLPRLEEWVTELHAS